VSYLRLGLVVALAAACGSEPEPTAPRVAPRSAPIVFAYGTPRGEEVGSATTRGRVTALLFVTTFDLPSQLMARRLEEIVKRHRPRVNAAAIALEAPNSAPLVEVFRSTLGLSYPVALGSSQAMDHDGPFGTLDRVPTLIVLDARGREVAREAGVVSAADVEMLLTRASR
jgi:hypothetical protein